MQSVSDEKYSFQVSKLPTHSNLKVEKNTSDPNAGLKENSTHETRNKTHNGSRFPHVLKTHTPQQLTWSPVKKKTTFSIKPNREL